MGNERSHLAGLEIDEDAIEVTENWSMYSASVNNGNLSRLSVFISPMFPGLSKPHAPSLIQAAKNLMLHRHPCIVKYVSTWSHGGRFHLATEEVYPLALVLDQQTPLQICVGLHSILKALIFLHDKAKASHNNVCLAAVYASPDGTWKLGGFEFLCLFRDLTSARLQQMRVHRYERAVPPEEDNVHMHPTAIDQYAFGVLVEEVFKKLNGAVEELHSCSEFHELARRQLQNHEPSLRPPLGPLLEHPFFDNAFLHIYSFLLELPLKTESERQNFFRSLPGRLADFPEEVVASQLSALLLSRMVLLDSTARDHLLPALLQPRRGEKNVSEEEAAEGVFSMPVFQQHIVPRLLQMLCVRDAQVRTLLLAHFQHFLPAFTAEQLRTSVLPELLVGIKDTSDQMVSMTLRALADMVPVLGATVVIGGKRAKLFTDGRPKMHRSPMKEPRHRSELPAVQVPAVSVEVTSNGFAVDLPERPSPDGGEAEVEDAGSDRGEEEAWSDWDLNDAPVGASHIVNSTCPALDVVATSIAPLSAPSSAPSSALPDIMTLDIKNLASSAGSDEFDFFQDMEPVISKAQIVQVDKLKKQTFISGHGFLTSNCSLEPALPKDMEPVISKAQIVQVDKLKKQTFISRHGFLTSNCSLEPALPKDMEPVISKAQIVQVDKLKKQTFISRHGFLTSNCSLEPALPKDMEPVISKAQIVQVDKLKKQTFISRHGFLTSNCSLEPALPKDMEPVISKAQIVQVDELKKQTVSLFEVALAAAEGDEGGAWGDDDLGDWGLDEEVIGSPGEGS